MGVARRMKDNEVVDAFVQFLAANGNEGLMVDRRPEKERDGDIEAVAGPFAIEHTSVDCLPDQRRRSAYLDQLIGDLETTVVTRRPMRVFLHYDAVERGQDWAIIRRTLRAWLETEGQNLPQGRIRVRIPGLPFDVDVVTRDGWETPRGVYFGRYVPADDASLPSRLRELCDRKVEKLAKWADRTTTVLLLESDDIALMNEMRLIDAMISAYPGGVPAGVAQIWYVNTAGQPQLLFYEITGSWAAPEDERYPEPAWWPPQR